MDILQGILVYGASIIALIVFVKIVPKDNPEYDPEIAHYMYMLDAEEKVNKL